MNRRERKGLVFRYGVYILRWQLFTPILAAVVGFTSKKLGYGFLMSAAIANLIGGLIFFWVDSLIFRKRVNREGQLDLSECLDKAA